PLCLWTLPLHLHARRPFLLTAHTALPSVPTRRSSDLLDHPLTGEQIAVAGVAGGQHTVEHIDAPAHRLQDVPWLAHPHQVAGLRSEEHTSELQSREKLVCRRLLEKKKCLRTYRHWCRC